MGFTEKYVQDLFGIKGHCRKSNHFSQEIRVKC